MTDAVRFAFQTECRANLGRATIAGQQASLVGQTKSQYFALVPRAGAKSVLGALVQFAITYTAGAAQSAVATQTVGTTTTPTDLLDGGFNQIEVAPAPNANARSTITQRMAAEELERITLNIKGYTYPRAVPAAFAGAGSRTDTTQIFVPIGGPGAAVRFQIPNVTAVYAANVTATVIVTVYVVSGDQDCVVTYNEKQTPPLGTGRNDMGPYFPVDMAPDFVCFLNETIATTTIVYVTAADGTILVDFQDTGLITVAQAGVVAPDTTITYNDLVFALDRKRFLTFLATFGTAGVRDIFWIEYAGSTVTNPAPNQAPIPSNVPASTQTGTPLAYGGAVTQPTGALGITIGSPGPAYALGAGPPISTGQIGIMGGVPFTRKAR